MRAQFVDRLGVPHKFDPLEMCDVFVHTLPLFPNTEKPFFNSDTFNILVWFNNVALLLRCGLDR